MHLVYIVHNSVNHKIYVGQTQRTLRQRWLNHLSTARQGRDLHLYRAIRKYGESSFFPELVAKVKTKDEASDLEKLLIVMFNACDADFGYNNTFGGEGAVLTKESKAKQSKAMLEWWTPERRAAVSIARKGRLTGAKNPMYGKGIWTGKKHSPETKAKISAKRKEMYANPEFKARMSAANTGKKHTEEGRKNIAKGLIGNQYRKGIPHSEEIKEKIRQGMFRAHDRKHSSKKILDNHPIIG